MKTIIANNDKNAFAKVDDDVFETIQDMKLKFCVRKDGYWYSTSHNIQLQGMNKKKCLLLHRFVWILKNGEEPLSSIDHIDNHPCNNQISNLRLATSQQQNQHQNKRKDNTSGMIGVSHQHTNKKSKTGGYDYWLASIMKPDGKREKKLFPYTENGLIEAGRWYDTKAIEYFGNFAVLNFPDE